MEIPHNIMGKLKILELCHFSSGICGVWNRVREESVRLSEKGYEVQVFSSRAIKGSREKVPISETISKVKVRRFPYFRLGGESFMFWNFYNDAIEYSPDVIITHVYRHIHTTTALKIKEKLERMGKKCVVILVTHAPFNEDNSERGLPARLSVWFYDKFIGPRKINKFDRIITISHWEVPYLLKIGTSKTKLSYVPNGIPEIFFKSKSQFNKDNKMLFLGRIAPVKSLETAIFALTKLNDYSLELVGPIESNYEKYLKSLIKKEGLSKRVTFSRAIYGSKNKIRKLDSSSIFILPSKREGMPQSLIESMARSRICIGSDVEGIRDLVKNNENGLIFKVGVSDSLVEAVKSLKNKNLKNISRNAHSFASQFKWDLLTSRLDRIIKDELKN
ncbi:glycosyltransferase family 4 protein [Candidatus Pacearchaeota archaeon]|nr:glycosyltransferase family 4 protein [Candidatus Pacearchaeota archaeon]